MAYPIPLPEPPPIVELGEVSRQSTPMLRRLPARPQASFTEGGRSPYSPSFLGEVSPSLPPSTLFPSGTFRQPERVAPSFQDFSLTAQLVAQARPVATSQAEAAVTAVETEAESLILSPRRPPIALPETSPPLAQTDVSEPAAPTPDRQVQTVTPEPPEPESADLEPSSPEPLRPETVFPDEPVGEDDIQETPVVLFPPGATPEPFWFNGGVTTAGELLTPTQPTNRPDLSLDLTADYQEFDPIRQTVTAEGDVLLQLNNGVLTAQRLWANLSNRYVLVEGSVVFERGQQIIRAERGEYNLLQGEGSLFDARGSLFLPALGTDLALTSPEEVGSDVPSIAELLQEGTVDNVRATGELSFGAGGGGPSRAANLGGGGPGIRRVRFEADRVDFDAEGSIARNIRITNDPFSPPELEITGDSATLTRLNEFEDELLIERGRIVFDQRFRLPLLRSRILFSRRETSDLTPFSIGFDGDDRDGLFIERTFGVYNTPTWQLNVTPQLLVQRFFLDQDTTASTFGLELDLTGQLGPRTRIEAGASISGFDLVDNLDERLRSSVRLQQLIGTHTLNLEYSFRDRLFNGSLGFQDVRSSIGAVLVSPRIVLGDTGITLNYQASAQLVNAESDLLEFREPFEPRGLARLGRFQGSASLSRTFSLWRGEPLPPTPDEGLRYTPRPVVPNLSLVVGGRGTYSYYTNQDTQSSLSAFVGIRGQLGRFSRKFFDSTVFNLTYRRSFIGEGRSPFLFDRNVDQNVLSGGILQQIYGPFRIGFQASFNLESQELISTTYIVEYSRRTYGVLLRFNPERRSGFLGFRLSDFDWSGRAARFGGADIRDVEDGVVR